MTRITSLGLAVLALGVCLVALGVYVQPSAVALYTAPHSEVAPFQRVWNPDTNNDYTVKDFASDASEDDGPVQDELCGSNGDDCPELPAFNGEDIFDDKPIGCCYDKKQQATWEKWQALKNKVSRLEGTVRFLSSLKSQVSMKYRLSKSILGNPGPPGPAGPPGPMGGQVTLPPATPIAPSPAQRTRDQDQLIPVAIPAVCRSRKPGELNGSEKAGHHCHRRLTALCSAGSRRSGGPPRESWSPRRGWREGRRRAVRTAGSAALPRRRDALAPHRGLRCAGLRG